MTCAIPFIHKHAYVTVDNHELTSATKQEINILYIGLNDKIDIDQEDDALNGVRRIIYMKRMMVEGDDRLQAIYKDAIQSVSITNRKEDLQCHQTRTGLIRSID
eukprot:1055580_1